MSRRETFLATVGIVCFLLFFWVLLHFCEIKGVRDQAHELEQMRHAVEMRRLELERLGGPVIQSGGGPVNVEGNGR